jgi:hypothetical protein
MNQTHRNFNRAVVREVIYDDLLGELQIVVTVAPRARRSLVPPAREAAPPSPAAPAKQPATGPPTASPLAMFTGDRRHD